MTFLVVIHSEIVISPLFHKNGTFPPISKNLLIPPCLKKMLSWFRWIYLLFAYFTCVLLLPTLTMMHLCIMQCMYWTPLSRTYFGQSCKCIILLGAYIVCSLCYTRSVTYFWMMQCSLEEWRVALGYRYVDVHVEKALIIINQVLQKISLLKHSDC